MASIISLSLRNNNITQNYNKKLEFLLEIEELMNQNMFYIVGDELLRIYYRDTHILPSDLNKLVNFIKKVDGFRNIVVDMYYTSTLHKV